MRSGGPAEETRPSGSLRCYAGFHGPFGQVSSKRLCLPARRVGGAATSSKQDVALMAQ